MHSDLGDGVGAPDLVDVLRCCVLLGDALSQETVSWHYLHLLVILISSQVIGVTFNAQAGEAKETSLPNSPWFANARTKGCKR